jgi:hypothetical protein
MLKRSMTCMLQLPIRRQRQPQREQVLFRYVIFLASFILVRRRQSQQQIQIRWNPRVVGYCAASSSTWSSSSSTSASTSTTSSNVLHKNRLYYKEEDVRALDEYGNAQQLQYAAHAASHVNGRLIVVVTNMPTATATTTAVSSSSCSESEPSISSSSSAVWIISPITPKSIVPQNHRYHRSTTYRISNSNSNNNSGNDTTVQPPQPQFVSLVKDIFPNTLSSSSTSSSSSSSSVYMIATGLRTDVQYVLQQLRLYYKYNWERYDTTSSMDGKPTNTITAISIVLQFILRQFWNYPTGIDTDTEEDDNDSTSGSSSAAWIPMGYRQMLQSSSAQQPSWGRPFGITGLLLQWNQPQQRYTVMEFNPTGIATTTPTRTFTSNYNSIRTNANRSVQIKCFGPHHTLVHDELQKVQSQLQNERSNSGSEHTNSTSLEQIVIGAIESALGVGLDSTTMPNKSNNINDDHTTSETSVPQYQLEIIHPSIASSSQGTSTMKRIIQRQVK